MSTDKCRVKVLCAVSHACAAVLIAGAPAFAQLSPHLITKLIAADTSANDNFSSAAAIDGNTVVIGAPGDDHAGSQSGSAYVFTRSGNGWTEQAKLTASDPTAGSGFGVSVAIDDDTVVIGANTADGVERWTGALYVFVRDGEYWTEQAKITAADGARNDRFGQAVAIDGNTIVTGAAADDHAGTLSGSAYVFIRNDAVWADQAKLTADVANDYDSFGVAVAILGDTVVIGAARDAAYSAGSAYVFTRSGDLWTEQAELKAADPIEGTGFGYAVAMSGETLLVSSNVDSFTGPRLGAVFIYTGSGSVWNEQAKLMASDGADLDLFGFSVAVDGDTAVISSWQDGDAGSSSGSAYLFTRSGALWTEQVKLVAVDGAAFDNFGDSVAIAGDITVIGAIHDDDAGYNSGSAYLYSLADADGDGVVNDADNCALTPNTNQVDQDADAVGDVCDNCVLDANPDQCNTNGNGTDAGQDDFGNACDADLDNNNIVNTFDLSILRSNFGETGLIDADLNCDGVVNTFDLARMRNRFGAAPGPTGLAP